MQKSSSLLFLSAFILTHFTLAAQNYSRNAATCEQCHFAPSRFGSSRLTVQRVGSMVENKFIPGEDGGILHRTGSKGGPPVESEMVGDRVTLSLLGDGYIEAIDPTDIRKSAEKQRQIPLWGIHGTVVSVPALESRARTNHGVGRFGWKAQHSSLFSACADSMRNELGIRNFLYPDKYPSQQGSAVQPPFDVPDPRTRRTELSKLVNEVRRTPPPARDEQLILSFEVQEGEKLFTEIGCAVCHVPSYKTLPAGTFINGSTYRVPAVIGNKIIHPFSDFLLHDIGTGDGIPQAARPEYLDQSTANRFRTPPLWGLRFRSWMMHDGKSVTYHQSVMRHGGEGAKIRERYEALTPVQREQLWAFLNSL